VVVIGAALHSRVEGSTRVATMRPWNSRSVLIHVAGVPVDGVHARIEIGGWAELPFADDGPDDTGTNDTGTNDDQDCYRNVRSRTAGRGVSLRVTGGTCGAGSGDEIGVGGASGSLGRPGSGSRGGARGRGGA